MSLAVAELLDLPSPDRPYAMRINPWRVLEKIARHDGGRFSKSHGLSTHMPLRFEVISALAIARSARNGRDCLSVANGHRAPEANVRGKGAARQTRPSEFAPRFTACAMETVCW